jgi:hypothetical protein
VILAEINRIHRRTNIAHDSDGDGGEDGDTLIGVSMIIMNTKHANSF